MIQEVNKIPGKLKIPDSLSNSLMKNNEKPEAISTKFTNRQKYTAEKIDQSKHLLLFSIFPL